MDINDKQTKTILALVADLFETTALYRRMSQLDISLLPRYDRAKCIELLRDRLKSAGYKFKLDDKVEVVMLTIDPKPSRRIPTLNIVLFLATLLTVYFVPVFFRHASGATMSENFRLTLAALSRGEGLQFTVAMISILFVHEMGHFIAGKRRYIVTSYPYFIPAPNIIGTFGAVIRSKSPFWNRRDLIEVGAAGPIAGWIVAFCWLVYGLSQSVYQPISQFPITELHFSLEGESLLMKFLTLNLIGPAPVGQAYHLTEAAFAGWVGLLVTAINMLPIGQLDGGHVLYGLWRRRQHVLGLLGMVLLFVLGFQSPMWWIFAAMGLIFGVTHPPTLQDDRPLEKHAVWMGWAAIVIFILSFPPVPLSFR